MSRELKELERALDPRGRIHFTSGVAQKTACGFLWREIDHIRNLVHPRSDYNAKYPLHERFYRCSECVAKLEKP